MDELKKKIREIPDFPKKGILFYDITTLLKDPEGLQLVIKLLLDRYRDRGIQKILGIESRGFILAPLLAYHLEAGFVPVRKMGKLPAETVAQSYDLEYGTDTVEVHRDAVEKGEKILIVDDLIATGGTAAATLELTRKLGGEVEELAFLIELEFLNGRSRIQGADVFSLLKY